MKNKGFLIEYSISLMECQIGEFTIGSKPLEELIAKKLRKEIYSNDNASIRFQLISDPVMPSMPFQQI